MIKNRKYVILLKTSLKPLTQRKFIQGGHSETMLLAIFMCSFSQIPATFNFSNLDIRLCFPLFQPSIKEFTAYNRNFSTKTSDSLINVQKPQKAASL